MNAMNSLRFIFNAKSTEVSVVLGFSGKVHELVNIEAVSRSGMLP